MRQILCTTILLLCALAGLAVAQPHPPPLQTASLGLELDGGQRWVVDGAMMAQLRSMESDLVTFQGIRPDDYRKLAGRLEKQLARLVAGCTMTGKAHDELHKWLIPYMAEVKAFVKDDDIATLKARQKSLRSSFEVFNTYFR